MSDIDDKLKAIILSDVVFSQRSRMQDAALKIERIKQVFADAGYVHVPQMYRNDNGEVVTVQGKLVMTGQEFYERFKKEFYSTASQPRDLYVKQIKRAVKRAAGLKDAPNT